MCERVERASFENLHVFFCAHEIYFIKYNLTFVGAPGKLPTLPYPKLNPALSWWNVSFVVHQWHYFVTDTLTRAVALFRHTTLIARSVGVWFLGNAFNTHHHFIDYSLCYILDVFRADSPQFLVSSYLRIEIKILDSTQLDIRPVLL